MFRILLSPRADKDLKKLSLDIRRKLDLTFRKLSENPFQISQTKYLKDRKLANFRIRMGDYRILYDVYTENNTVYILRIGHRKDIYK